MPPVIAERVKASSDSTARFDDPTGLSVLICCQDRFWSVEVGRVEWAAEIDAPAWFDAAAWATCLDLPPPPPDLASQLTFLKNHWPAIASSPSSLLPRLQHARQSST